MPRKSEIPQTRRHVHIYDEDWEWLNRNYGPDSESKVGISTAIRQIIHKFVSTKQAEIQERIDGNG
jgi:hypothetical protein